MSDRAKNKNNKLPMDIRNSVNKLLDSIENMAFPDSSGTGIRANITETPDEYLIKAELPGVQKGDINIELNGNYLTISATRHEEAEYQGDYYIRREIASGLYRRTFYIKSPNKDGISAKFGNGILSIKVQKLKLIDDENKISIE